MTANDLAISSGRLKLRNWRESDRASFAALNADPEIMQDLGGPLDRQRSDAKFNRYRDAYERHGFCRWALEDMSGALIGYTGIMPSRGEHPLGFHVEIGWRLKRSAWGRGYATEAARAALNDAFTRAGLREILSYTAVDNLRSQAVMSRVGLRRDPARDFTAVYEGTGAWHGLVWVATKA